MAYIPRSSGGSSISNAGGTVSIDGDGAVHVTPADGQNTNIAGGALAITATTVEDADVAVSDAVGGHQFKVAGSLVATIDETGITGTPISGSTGAFTTLSAMITSNDDVPILKLDVTSAGYGLAISREPITGDYKFTKDNGGGGYRFDSYLSLAGDTILLRAAANTLALRHSTAGQNFIVSRSYTDASNYSQLSIAASGSAVAFTIDEAGTGGGTMTEFSFNGGPITGLLNGPSSASVQDPSTDSPVRWLKVLVAGTEYAVPCYTPV